MSIRMKKGLLFVATLLLLAGCKKNQEFDVTGTFEAKEVTISAETSGKVLSLDLEEGQALKAGDCVGMIDTMQLFLQRGQLVEQQRALLHSKPNAEKQVSSLREQIQQQEREVARVERLLSDDVATQKQLDDARTYLNVLRNQLDATLSTLSTSNASIDGNAAAMEWQIKQIDNAMTNSCIASPIDGTVLVKYVEQGEMAVVGMPIMKIADLEHMFLRAFFTSDQLSKVKIGQKVKVIADFGGDEQYEYEGTVCWISAESEFTPKGIQTRNSRANLVYATKIAVKNDGRLKIGLYGEVKL